MLEDNVASTPSARFFSAVTAAARAVASEAIAVVNVASAASARFFSVVTAGHEQ